MVTIRSSAAPTGSDVTLTIDARVVGAGHPAYVIAEMSGNHNHRFDDAVAIVRAAKAAGADAVKVQTYTPDTLTIDCDNRYFQLGPGTLWAGRKLYELYSEAYTPWEWQPRLKELAAELGIGFFSTPFDDTAVAFLETMGVGAYKIASFEIVDLALIRRVAATGKPIIMSTGMATLGEIDEAVSAARSAGCVELALLKCTSAYPSAPSDMNLRTLTHLGHAFDAVPGLSDHTLGITVPVAAVALGACIIEKHFTLSRTVPGPDSAFSLEPLEFRAMVDAVRQTEAALGSVRYGVTPDEEKSRVFRRSLFVVADVAAGELLTPANIRSIRPGFGLAPRHLPDVLGRRAARAISRGTPLEWSLVAGA